MASNFLKNLKAVEKDFYTISDLEKISGLKRKSLLVALARLVKRGEILRVYQGVYLLPEQKLDAEKIANQIYDPSYVSFESALSRYGILSQIPYTLTLATTKKPKKIELARTIVEYRRIKKELFFGFSLIGGVYVAEPEKALLDQLYFVALGKATLSLEELDVSQIDQARFWRYAKNFPVRVAKLAGQIISDR